MQVRSLSSVAPRLGRVWPEIAARDLLAVAGLPMLPQRRADTAEAAGQIAAELGGEVVVKLCAEGLVHKIERGALRLGVRGAEEVRAAAAELLAGAGDLVRPSLLVAPRLHAGRELVAGVRVDARYGPVVAVGLGGVWAEVLDDVVVRLAPLSAAEALDAVDDLVHQPVFGAWRGEPPVDPASLAAVVVALGDLPPSVDGLVAAEINPLLVVDGRPVGVDALIEVES